MKEYKIKINGNDYAVEINDIDGENAQVSVNGVAYDVKLDNTGKPKPKVARPVAAAPAVATPSAGAPKAAPKAASGAGTPIKSPLPGTILDVFVREGDSVKSGQRLMLLEAMKMENNIDCDHDGVVKSISARKGDSVLEGDILLTIG